MAVTDNLFVIGTGWLSNTEFSLVVASGQTSLGATAIDALILFPGVTSSVWTELVAGNVAVFVEAEVTSFTNPAWTTSRVYHFWRASAWAWTEFVDSWAVRELDTRTIVPLAEWVFWVDSKCEYLVFWTLGFRLWYLFIALIATAARWALPEITAIVLSSVFGHDLLSVALAVWLLGTHASSIDTFDFVAGNTSTGFALIDLPLIVEIVALSVVHTGTLCAWEWDGSQLVIPAVVSFASRPNVFSLTWSDLLTVWKFAITVAGFDTSLKVSKNESAWTLNWLFLATDIHTGTVVVSALRPYCREAVADFMAFECTKILIFILTFTDWSGGLWTFWSSSSGKGWCGWSSWNFGLARAWKTNTLGLSVHTVTRLTSIRHGSNLLALGVLDAVDLLTEALVHLQTFGSVLREHGLIDTLATFDANVLALSLNSFPLAEVGAG